MRKIVVYLNDKILEGFSVDDDVKERGHHRRSPSQRFSVILTGTGRK